MANCPACNQTIQPGDLACPRCGVSLHQYRSSHGASDGGTGGMVTYLLIAAGLGLVVCTGILTLVMYARSI